MIELMLSTLNVFLISAFFCVVMLLVWCSLLRSGIRGVREWSVANGLGVVAFLLFAFGKSLPPLIAYELANATYAAASASVLIGFQRFLGRETSIKAVAAGIVLLTIAIAVFHYALDSFMLRTQAVSTFQVAVCLAIGLTVFRARQISRSRYPTYFTLSMALIVALGHGARGVVHVTNSSELTSLLQPSMWNVVFLSLGTVMLPALTLGAIMMVHDRMMAKAEHAANRDFLTGAWSRRAFFELAERELARARRGAHAIALLAIDIDHFKSINDTLGHQVGDEVLVDMALRVETVTRSIDYFSRVGGEEFAVLLPDTDRPAALMIAERLRAALDRSKAGGQAAAYTVSIGVATLRGTDSFRELMRRADAALYQAKAMGRNRVICESI